MAGQYSRSCSSESAAQMLSPDPRTPVKSKLILGVVTGGVALLMVQVCATAGLFIYFTREISKVNSAAWMNQSAERVGLMLTSILFPRESGLNWIWEVIAKKNNSVFRDDNRKGNVMWQKITAYPLWFLLVRSLSVFYIIGGNLQRKLNASSLCKT